MANYVRETFIWHWRSASRPPRPLPDDFYVLRPRFSLAEAESVATKFGLPEIVPANEVEVRGSPNGQRDGSGSVGPPGPSSDEE